MYKIMGVWIEVTLEQHKLIQKPNHVNIHTSLGVHSRECYEHLKSCIGVAAEYARCVLCPQTTNKCER
jgi:hypothetical protein